MGISLAVIIGVQVNWISNAVRFQNNEFDFRVANSLSNTAGYLESSRRMAFLNQPFFDSHSFVDTVQSKDGMMRRAAPSNGPGSENYSYEFRHRSTTFSDGQGKSGEISGSIEIGRDENNGGDSVEIIFSTNGKPPVKMKVQASRADSAMESVMVPPR